MAGFDELNLNVGCPSERVRQGGIGACLMREPRRVADGVAAMRDAVALPVTVKCRIGVEDRPVPGSADDDADYADFGRLRDFVGEVAAAGVQVFIVHARKAVLSGLTPAQNRSVPPLRPALVARLKADFPRLGIVYNGGIRDTQVAREHLEWADGVMVGRGAYRNPVWLSELDAALFGSRALRAAEALRRYLPYVEARLAQGVALHAMTRHLLTIFNGQPGARRFRQHLSAHGARIPAGIDVLLEAAALVGGELRAVA
jgi:tRNA-dihydrouridine synthase A